MVRGLRPGLQRSGFNEPDQRAPRQQDLLPRGVAAFRSYGKPRWALPNTMADSGFAWGPYRSAVFLRSLVCETAVFFFVLFFFLFFSVWRVPLPETKPLVSTP